MLLLGKMKITKPPWTASLSNLVSLDITGCISVWQAYLNFPQNNDEQLTAGRKLQGQGKRVQKTCPTELFTILEPQNMLIVVFSNHIKLVDERNFKPYLNY